MPPTRAETETLIKATDLTQSMPGEDELEDVVSGDEEHWKKVDEQLDRIIDRFLGPNGFIEKYGQTDHCLTFVEFDSYVDGRLSKRRRTRYDAHIRSCDDCSYVLQHLRQYLARVQSSNALAVLTRAAIAVPYRVRDYLDEMLSEPKRSHRHTTLTRPGV